MKVVLYMAISTDGFIAKKDGDSDWVSQVDFAIFQGKIKETGCIIVGRRTFNQYHGEMYPVKGVTNIVLTTNNFSKKEEKTFFVNSPKEALQVAKKEGHNQVLLIGGATTNGMFLKENLIDEMYLSIHPLILGEGIKLFEDCEVSVKLKLLGLKQLRDDLIQLHYLIKK